jgi:hypothetical protein
MISPFYKTAPNIVASIMKVSAHLEVGFVFCWIIVAEKLGHKNLFVKFLSKRFFIQVAKSTYSMYLITPIIAILISGLTSNGLSYDFPEMVSENNRSLNLINNVFKNPFFHQKQIILSYAIIKVSSHISFFVTAHFETPFCNLSKYILQKKTSVEKIK